jgi:hypothetical protein
MEESYGLDQILQNSLKTFYFTLENSFNKRYWLTKSIRKYESPYIYIYIYTWRFCHIKVNFLKTQ